jgi:hypothetical protein
MPACPCPANHAHGKSIASALAKHIAAMLVCRGGIPVVFPQYGRGVLPTNGLLQRMHWSIAETGTSHHGNNTHDHCRHETKQDKVSSLSICRAFKSTQQYLTPARLPAGVADPEIARDPAPSVALWAEADSFTLGVWPHRFEAMYTVRLWPRVSMGCCMCCPAVKCVLPGRPGLTSGSRRHSPCVLGHITTAETVADSLFVATDLIDGA